MAEEFLIHRLATKLIGENLDDTHLEMQLDRYITDRFNAFHILNALFLKYPFRNQDQDKAWAERNYQWYVYDDFPVQKGSSVNEDIGVQTRRAIIMR